VGIDIGTVTRLADTAGYSLTESIKADYETLSEKASNCTECGICMENCPFSIDVVANMARAATTFGK